MDWQELEQLIRGERRAGNPVAALIHSLQLDQNKVTLVLANNLDEEVGEGGQRRARFRERARRGWRPHYSSFRPFVYSPRPPPAR